MHRLQKYGLTIHVWDEFDKYMSCLDHITICPNTWYCHLRVPEFKTNLGKQTASNKGPVICDSRTVVLLHILTWGVHNIGQSPYCLRDSCLCMGTKSTSSGNMQWMFGIVTYIILSYNVLPISVGLGMYAKMYTFFALTSMTFADHKFRMPVGAPVACCWGS